MRNSYIDDNKQCKWFIRQRVVMGMAAILIGFSLLLPQSAMSASPSDFVITVKTDNPGTSSNTQFIIPTYSGETYIYDVDFNNDEVYELTGVTGNTTCTYAVSGTYTIRIKGAFPRIYFNDSEDCRKIISIDQWGTGIWSSMGRAFEGCSNLAGQATDAPDLSSVTDMYWMFASASAFNQDIENWNTANVTDMCVMFYSASAFNQDIGNWNTANVTNMSLMFYSASAFNQDIGNWNTANVTNMRYMFFSASAFNQAIGNWNTGNVTNMRYMFYSASAFNQDIGNWNVENMIDMVDMFYNVTLSTTNYDALLIGWDAQNLQNGVIFHAGNSQYNSSAAQTARANMINSDNWTITDGGLYILPAISPTATLSPTVTVTLGGKDMLAFPNPAQNQVTFAFELDQAGVTKVEVYNLAGERVGQVSATLAAGMQTLVWDCAEIAPGVYLARITVDGKEKGKVKIAVVK